MVSKCKKLNFQSVDKFTLDDKQYDFIASGLIEFNITFSKAEIGTLNNICLMFKCQIAEDAKRATSEEVKVSTQQIAKAAGKLAGLLRYADTITMGAINKKLREKVDDDDSVLSVPSTYEIANYLSNLEAICSKSINPPRKRDYAIRGLCQGVGKLLMSKGETLSSSDAGIFNKACCIFLEVIDSEFDTPVLKDYLLDFIKENYCRENTP